MRADGELLAKSLPLASGAPRTAARRGGKLRLRFLSSFRCAHARRRRRVGSLFLLLGLGLRSRRVLPLLALASLQRGEVSLARGRRVLQHVLEVVLSGQPLPVQHATVFAALLAAGKLARRIAALLAGGLARRSAALLAGGLNRRVLPLARRGGGGGRRLVVAGVIELQEAFLLKLQQLSLHSRCSVFEGHAETLFRASSIMLSIQGQ